MFDQFIVYAIFTWGFRNVGRSVGMNGLIFLTNSTYLEPQKLVTFGLQLCSINH